ncbi:MAG: biotin--[acetyl-CoA-carboxylase] ligase, partial [Actinomycetes bacterium]
MTFDSAKAALASTRFVDLRWVQETGSTNADMVGLLAEVTVSPDRPVVLVTDFQSAGRGRLDRTWAAPAGSSVLMTIGLPIAHVPADRWTLLTSALALAVAGAPSVEGVLKVKWPNDLVAVGVGDDGGDRKVGGVLAELRDIPGRGSCALLGIGLNANWPDLPADLQSTATSLQR